MEFRVEDLAARAGTPVDTLRYYQTRGLLPPPRRAGRIAWYGEAHLQRLLRIRRLAADGFTLEEPQHVFQVVGSNVGSAEHLMLTICGCRYVRGRANMVT